MSSSKFLGLLLDAPLQSWGYQSRFDRRTTLSHPTRSGLVGMLCAAMGIDRSDTTQLAQFEGLTLTLYVFQTAGRLMDFHTVGGGWDKKIHPQNVVPKADGSSGNTVVTRREFLQHSKFGAVLEGDSDLLNRIAQALQHPKWGIWLGRKSCIPASPVFQGLFDSSNDALKHLEERAGHTATLMIREVDQFDEGTDTLMDRPIDFAKRTFIPRRICVEVPGGD